MVTIPTIPFISHRKRRSEQPDQGGLAILRVASSGPPARLTVFFPENVAYDHQHVPTEFHVIRSTGESVRCIGVTAVYTNPAIELEFMSEVGPGDRWELNSPMDGITPVVAWPQSGVVE